LKTISNKIYLEDIIENKGHVLSGKNNGCNARYRFKIDFLEKLYDRIYVIVPEDIFSITPSFWIGLFGNVISKLGKEDFLNKFSFIPQHDYFDSLDEAIDRIISRKNIVGGLLDKIDENEYQKVKRKMIITAKTEDLIKSFKNIFKW
jgi:hypothetical protein